VSVRRLSFDDPDVRTTDEERRALIWNESAADICVAGEGGYYELFANAAG
jgi:hypothetical protein